MNDFKEFREIKEINEADSNPNSKFCICKAVTFFGAGSLTH